MSKIMRILAAEYLKSKPMELQQNNFCVILAGGRGRRLWPSSRHDRPKQFVDFFATGRTQLQATFDRMARIIPVNNIYVCTGADFAHLVHEQLPDIPVEHILAEPVNRNTGPSVAWAGRRIHRESDDARIIVVPSDQYIVNDEAFNANVLKGLDFVGHNDLMLTMGIQPTRPEPGYGYIQMGEATSTPGIFHVKTFTEKPDREFAKFFMQSGEFLWNTGIYLTNVNYLRAFCLNAFKDLGVRFASLGKGYTMEEEEHFMENHYPSYPNISLDKAALEVPQNVFVARCTFGWADLGTWHSIYECMQKREGDNVIIDSEVIIEDSDDNIIKLPKGHIGVINGLHGYIIAEQGDILLICKKGDSSALIRKYVNEVGIRYGESYM